MTGELERACQHIVRGNLVRDVDDRVALGLLDNEQAESQRHYRAALALDGRDAYLKGAYADFLLDNGRLLRARFNWLQRFWHGGDVEVADRQLLVNGKMPGTISMYVWERSGGLRRYVAVCHLLGERPIRIRERAELILQ